MRKAMILSVALSLAAGCTPRRFDPAPSGDGVQQHRVARPIEPDDAEYVVAVLLDLSGSFTDLMANQGKAWEFVGLILDKYFRNALGSNDKLVISQISGNDRALLWQGTPTQLRKDFKSAMDFRRFLLERADENASLIHDGIRKTVEYVMSDPAVASGRAKSAVFVLSDMIDTSNDRDESLKKAIGAVQRFDSRGGFVGFYYVDQHLLPQWRDRVATAGIVNCCVECEIVGTPKLPQFDE